MDVELTAEESTEVQRALRTYCSDLRMEIVDTDNPAYRRELREERTVLEGVLAKLDEAAANARSREDQAGVAATDVADTSGERSERVVIRLIGLWPNG